MASILRLELSSDRERSDALEVIGYNLSGDREIRLIDRMIDTHWILECFPVYVMYVASSTSGPHTCQSAA